MFHCGFFCFPGRTRVCPLAVVADMLVLAASEHLGELEICARDRLKCWGLGVACAILILVGFCG